MLQNKLNVFCCTFYCSLKGRVVEDNRTSTLKLDTIRPKDIYDQVFALSNEKCGSKTNQDSRFLYACVQGRRSCIWGGSVCFCLPRFCLCKLLADLVGPEF